jgi:hypothetical protein
MICSTVQQQIQRLVFRAQRVDAELAVCSAAALASALRFALLIFITRCKGGGLLTPLNATVTRRRTAHLHATGSSLDGRGFLS